jgi:TonB family protein
MLNLNAFLREEKKIKIAIFIFAILIHATAIMQKLDFSAFTNPQISLNENEPVKIQYIDPIELSRAIEKNNQILKKQIVQTQESEMKKKSETAFLGEKDAYFDRQTVARVVDKFNNGGGNHTADGLGQGEKTRSASKQVAKKISFKDIGLGLNKISPDTTPLEAEEAGGQRGLGRGVSSTNDYIEDVPLGDFTRLNTQEFKFYGFYHRIRSKLEQFWGRNIQEQAEKVFKQGRRIPASDNHVTSLLIKLNSQGEIVNVKVKSTSGIKELDDAAIESFNQAGPFPNPPKEMLVNGLATIEWGFVVNG